MILKLLAVLLIVSFSIFINDAHAQAIKTGESPFEQHFVGVKFLNAYFGTLDEKMEVSPGDQNVPLTVVLSNVGTNDIVGIKGQLSLPFGFSNTRNGEMLALADSTANALSGDIFSLTFYVNIANNAKLMTYPADVKLDYSRLRESGTRSDFFPIDFQLTGKSVINMKALNPILTSLQNNHVTIEVTNSGTSPISGVSIKLNNAVAENSSSQTITNVENVVILKSDWGVGDIRPQTSKQLDVDIFIPDSLKGATLRAPMEVTYFNAYGDKSTTTRMVDFYVNGLIDISTNGIKATKISGKDYIVGNIVNEGNEDGLFGYVTIKPINGSNLKEFTNFIDEIEVKSPIPFNIPVAFDGEPKYGTHDLEITVRYKDALRHEYFVTEQASVFIEEPPKPKQTDNSSLNFILPSVAIIGSVIVLGKKGYIPIKSKKTVK